MIIQVYKIALCGVISGLMITGSHAQGKQKKPSAVTFSKQVLTKDFVSEGVAIGDVNHDGKTDVIAGAFWFEAPHWKVHEIAKPETYVVGVGYSNSFLNFSMDVNQTGGLTSTHRLPGKAAVWHENPKINWSLPVHVIHASVGNEAPLFVI